MDRSYRKVVTGMVLGVVVLAAGLTSATPKSVRFTSTAVNAKIAEVKGVLLARGETKLAEMFEKCYPNTLETTVHYRQTADGKDETFVVTGDIPAMWLRDSAAQVWPYLKFVKEDEPLKRLIRGVLRKQFEFIRLDPYANAFNDLPWAEANEWADDKMDGVRVKKGVFERKYELDSLCYPLRLAHGYWRASGDISPFDADWVETVKRILSVMKDQQHKENWFTDYRFLRRGRCLTTESVANFGKGRQVKPVGLIGSFFRPSDDSTVFPFLVPSNMMAVDVLRKTAEILTSVNHDTTLAAECTALADEVSTALDRYALREHPTAGRIWAYEVDGFGNALFMDDANVPSLLALPYIASVPKDDPIYLATRKFVWSEANPWFFRGVAGEGIGGPHVGYGYIWPMSIIMKGLTSDSVLEMRESIEAVLKSDAGTSFVHESFYSSNANKFTRKWFAWANTLFGELIIKYVESVER